MPVQVKNYPAIQRFIKYNGEQAHKYAQEWFLFQNKHPETQLLSSEEDWLHWLATHRSLGIDPQLWQSREIQEVLSEPLRDYSFQPQEPTQSAASNVSETVANVSKLLVPLESRDIEEDLSYLTIKKQKMQDWQKNNPGKDFDTSEGQDYLYGSLDENTPVTTLNEEAEKEFRERFSKKAEKYDKKRKVTFQKASNDWTFSNKLSSIDSIAKKRYETLKKHGIGKTLEEIKNATEKNVWKEFARMYPEKAESYAAQYEPLKKALTTAKNPDQIDSTAPIVQIPQETSEQKDEESSMHISFRRPPPQPTPTDDEFILEAKDQEDDSNQYQSPSQTVNQPRAQPRQPRRPLRIPQPLSRMGSRIGQQIAKQFAKQVSKQLVRSLARSTASAVIAATSEIWIPILIIIILVIVTIAVLVGGASDSTQSGDITPTPAPFGPVFTGNLANCQFTRGDQTPSQAIFKSSVLLGYFQQASQLSGVPASVLAGIARVESPSVVNLTDADLPDYACTKSPTGALGLMQIQPRHTLGHDPEAVKKGASYLGLDYNSLTPADYCDLRKSVMLGAGFINQKRIYFTQREWDNSKTLDKSYINSVASSYYGCLRYPSCSAGPYSYGDDLYNSVQSCQVSPIQTTPNSFITSAPLPLLDSIVQHASSLVLNLRKGADGLFNLIATKPSIPLYWCTYLVIDAYNAAGLSGLKASDHLSVLSMKAFFQNTALNGGQYTLLPAATRVENLKPGDVVFFEGRGQHVSLIKSIDVDINGLGVIYTYDSNNIITEDKISVADHKALKAGTTARIYAITGFGRVVK